MQPRPAAEGLCGLELDVTLNELTEFWRRLGKRAVYAHERVWFDDKGNGVYLVYPYERVVSTPRAAIGRLLWQQRGLLARVTRPAEHAGFNAQLYVCDDHDYDMPRLAKHRRNVVRKGLKQAEHIGRVDHDLVLRDGYALELETLSRQTRRPQLPERKVWETRLAPWRDTPDTYCWGALAGGRLVAFMLVMNILDEVLVYWHRSGATAMKNGINNAMLFELVRETVVRGGARQLNYGYGSILSIDGLDWFKQTMGFRPVTLRQEFVPHPLLRPLLWRPALRLTSRVIRRVASTDRARKVAAAMALFAGDQAALEPSAPTAPDEMANVSSGTEGAGIQRDGQD